MVTLKRDSDGKSFELPITRLSDEDQAFIKEQSASPATETESDSPEPITGDYAKLITGKWELDNYKKLPFAFYGGEDLDGSKKYPLIVTLHQQMDFKKNGDQIMWAKEFSKKKNYAKRPCLILSPVCYAPYLKQDGVGWSSKPGSDTIDFIEELVKELPIVDPDRIYIVGFYLGAYGAWDLMNKEPKLFAAGMPISGHTTSVGKLRDMPLWTFHGAKDTVLEVEKMRETAELFKRSKVFKYTEFPNAGSAILGKVLQDEKVQVWLFEQKKD